MVEHRIIHIKGQKIVVVIHILEAGEADIRVHLILLLVGEVLIFQYIYNILTGFLRHRTCRAQTLILTVMDVAVDRRMKRVLLVDVRDERILRLHTLQQVQKRRRAILSIIVIREVKMDILLVFLIVRQYLKIALARRPLDIIDKKGRHPIVDKLTDVGISLRIPRKCCIDLEHKISSFVRISFSITYLVFRTYNKFTALTPPPSPSSREGSAVARSEDRRSGSCRPTGRGPRPGSCRVRRRGAVRGRQCERPQHRHCA